jgi:pimeloyl-ACP methyl ester carboxylesterase
MHRYRLASLACLLAVLSFIGCMMAPGPTTVPMGQKRYTLDAKAPRRCLIVMLPGYGDRDWTFEKRGMIAALRQSNVQADAIALDAHFGYYKKGLLLERVQKDVLEPAKKRGYERIWLVGASMGGAGALGVSAVFSQHIAGTLLLAPYLGGDIVDEVKDAGGLSRWKSGDAVTRKEYLGPSGLPRQQDRKTFFRYLWAWSKKRLRPDQSTVPLYVAVGVRDRLLTANRLLAAVLPKSHLLEDPGGHGWKAWLPLWRRFLKRGILQASCGQR